MGNASAKVQDYNIVVHSRSTEHSVDVTIPEQNSRSQTAPSSAARMSKAKSIAEFGVHRSKDPKQRPKSAKARLSLIAGDSKEALHRAASMRPSSTFESTSSPSPELGSSDLMVSNSQHPWLLVDWKVPHHFKIKDLQLRETLGHGYMGKVKLASIKDNENNKKFFAVKMINKDNASKNKVDHYVDLEKHALRLLNAKSQYSHMICKYFGAFEDKQTIFLCLEYIPGGTLASYLKKRSHLSQNEALFYISNLVLILEYIHAKGIVFRDLKPENIMITEMGYLKLIDFGFATSFYLDSHATNSDSKGRLPIVDGATQTRRLHTVCGTPAYLSPEQLDSKFTKGYTYIVDYWALGIICYELCYGDTPFSTRSDSNSYEIFLRILQNKIHFPYRLFNRINAHTKALICSLCHADSEKRLCHIQDIKSHPFFVLPWDAVKEQRVGAPYVPKVTEPSDKKKPKDYKK